MQENRQSQNPSTGTGSGFHSASDNSAAGGQGMTGSGSSGHSTSGAGSSQHSQARTTSSKSGGDANGGIADMVDGALNDIPTSAKPHERTEGTVARMIESQTSKLPSDTFLWAAVGAMATSAVCELSGWKSKSRFFGQWVAPLLLFGVYIKLVKVHGHDEVHRG